MKLNPTHRMARRAVGIAAAALVLASCGSTSSTTAGPSVDTSYGLAFNTSTVPWLAANQNGSGAPKTGGTLKIVGSSDLDHLDTASTYTYWGDMALQAISRQLYSYPATTDLSASYQPAPDVAAAMPTVSADGKTYTIKIRSGVMWNTSPPRAVTSQDFLYGFKRLCNPVAPVGAPQYYTTTIVGFSDYCTRFGAVAANLPAMQKFMANNAISGIATPDASTLVFTLTQPASDFVNILAVSFASAAPAEYNAYVPDSAQLHNHWISDGPYTVATYTPNQELDLSRNTAWSQASDPIRHAYVDAVQIKFGQTDQSIQQQIEAGTADLEWDTTVPTADLEGLINASPRDSRLGVFPSPDINPYEVFNMVGNKTLKNVKVRQALEYAVDKVAINKLFGGTDLGSPLNQLIPPSSEGHVDFNDYSTPSNEGDPAKCKTLLTAAGVSHLTLTDVYQNSGNAPNVEQEISKDFGACGVTVKGVPVSSDDFFGNYLSSASATKSDAWDIAEPAWFPDWHGNNGRTVVQPLVDGRGYGDGSTDFGGYDNPTVDALIDKALAASDPTQAANYWHQVDEQVMQDAVIIPMRTEDVAIFHGARVHNAIFSWESLQYQITAAWLS